MATMGFDTSELDSFSRDLLSLATTTLPRETKKMLKKSATKLSKVQKNVFKGFGIGDTGITEREVLKTMKAGKVYKYSGDLTCRAYCSSPLGHLLDQGHLLKGGRNHDGAEVFVPGYKFIDKAQSQFGSVYNQDLQEFIDKMLNENGL